MAVDLTTCPHCGASPMEVCSIERTEGRADINLFDNDERGVFEAEWGGSTDYFGESITLCYQCTTCYNELPEEYADAMDRLLGNTREKENAA